MQTVPTLDGPRFSVPSGGPTVLDVRIQLWILAWSPPFILGTVFLTNGGAGWEPIPKAILGLAGLCIYDLLLTGVMSVRRIDLDPEGVTFHYLFNQERGRWSDLRPHRNTSKSGGYFRHGSWSLTRHTESGGYRGNKLTREQALAVIRYPGRPAWDFSGAPWEALAREAGVVS